MLLVIGSTECSLQMSLERNLGTSENYTGQATGVLICSKHELYNAEKVGGEL